MLLFLSSSSFTVYCAVDRVKRHACSIAYKQHWFWAHNKTNTHTYIYISRHTDTNRNLFHIKTKNRKIAQPRICMYTLARLKRHNIRTFLLVMIHAINREGERKKTKQANKWNKNRSISLAPSVFTVARQYLYLTAQQKKRPPH